MNTAKFATTANKRLQSSNVISIVRSPNKESEMKYAHLSIERLKELLAYDPETGVFTWLKRPSHNSRSKVGDVAGALKNRGYRYIGIDSRTYLASQLAFLYVHGRWADGNVGLKDENPSNVRADNLVELRSFTGEHGTKTREGRARYNLEYRKAHPGVHRDANYKRYYGISANDYLKMFLEQQGVCAVCRQPERAKSRSGEIKWLSVDHNHDTKAIRGLLCAACNHVIGHSTEDPSILRAAADYLDRFKATQERVA